MIQRPIVRLALAGFAATAAVYWLIRSIAGGSHGNDTFFFDVSAGRLFTAPGGSVPPIRGVDGPEEDAFRAVVVSVSGNPADKASWRVAYLERYSPELKQQIEASQAGGPPSAMGRGGASAHRWVRRTNEVEWVSLGSEAGERIVSEWMAAGVNGATPAICTP